MPDDYDKSGNASLSMFAGTLPISDSEARAMRRAVVRHASVLDLSHDEVEELLDALGIQVASGDEEQDQ